MIAPLLDQSADHGPVQLPLLREETLHHPAARRRALGLAVAAALLFLRSPLAVKVSWTGSCTPTSVWPCRPPATTQQMIRSFGVSTDQEVLGAWRCPTGWWPCRGPHRPVPGLRRHRHGHRPDCGGPRFGDLRPGPVRVRGVFFGTLAALVGSMLYRATGPCAEDGPGPEGYEADFRPGGGGRPRAPRTLEWAGSSGGRPSPVRRGGGRCLACGRLQELPAGRGQGAPGPAGWTSSWPRGSLPPSSAPTAPASPPCSTSWPAPSGLRTGSLARRPEALPLAGPPAGPLDRSGLPGSHAGDGAAHDHRGEPGPRLGPGQPAGPAQGGGGPGTPPVPGVLEQLNLGLEHRLKSPWPALGRPAPGPVAGDGDRHPAPHPAVG